MIHYTQGNIFDSKAQTLVNSVNCVGVMGKGLAKEFRERFPDMFREYDKACRRKEVRSGKPFIYRDLQRTILCFPTKDNWKGPSKYEFIEAGLRAIRDQYEKWAIASMAIPPLGCGLGGLDWPKVKALIEKHLAELPIEIEVYEPLPADLKVAHEDGRRVVQPVKMTLPLALVGELVRRARHGMPRNVPLGRLIVQKMAFFAQLAGAPIKLRFNKYKFGPYDHRLIYLIERLEGLFIRDESRSWQRSDLQMLDEAAWTEAVEPFRKDVEQNSKYLDAAVDLLKHRSIEEAELLATVQYGWCMVVASGGLGDEVEVQEYVARWSKEKKEKFTPEHVRKALEELGEAGWLGPSAPGKPSPLVDPAPEPGHAVLA